MQVYVERKSLIQELKEFGGRVLNGAKEGLKEVWKDSGIIAGASAAENGIKEAVKGYKAIQEFNATMKNGYAFAWNTRSRITWSRQRICKRYGESSWNCRLCGCGNFICKRFHQRLE